MDHNLDNGSSSFCEKGRSMFAMLGMLSIIALLSFTATSFLGSLNNKHKAGLLIKELGMVHSQLYVKSNKTTSDWEAYPFSSALPYAFFKRFDSTGNDFIKINGVEKSVCDALLANSIYTFYTTGNDLLTECQDENEIVVAFKKKAPVPFSSSGSDPDQLQCEGDQYFDGTGCQDKCTQASDCGSSDRDYCDADQHCAQCEEGERYNSSTLECEKVWADINGNIHFCSETGATSSLYRKEATAEECAKCDDSETPRIWGIKSDEGKGYCGLCPEGYFFQTDYMVCRSCNITGNAGFVSTEKACSACKNTSFPNHLAGDRCISDCTDEQYEDENGRCQTCSDGKFYDAVNGVCQFCSFNGIIQVLNQKQCENKCNNTRVFEDGKCLPICDTETQQQCSNEAETDSWCCDLDEICGSGEDEAHKCIVQNDNKCAYRVGYVFSSSVDCFYNLSYADGKIVLDEIEGCPAGEYCYLRYNNLCDLAKSGYYGTVAGFCQELSESQPNGQCTLDVLKMKMNTIKGCGENSYCYLRWDTDNNLAHTSYQGEIRGICVKENQNANQNTLNPWVTED